MIGAAIEVHRALGPGYLEAIYEQALAIELEERGISFERQRKVSVIYKEREIGECRVDFMVAGILLLELKSAESISPVHLAQVMSYLKATGLRLGLLINFNVPVLKDGIKRVVLS